MAIGQSRQKESNCIFQLFIRACNENLNNASNIPTKKQIVWCNFEKVNQFERVLQQFWKSLYILSYCAKEYASIAKISNFCIVQNFVTNIDSIMQEDSEMCRNNCKLCKSFYKCSNITLSWDTVF